MNEFEIKRIVARIMREIGDTGTSAWLNVADWGESDKEVAMRVLRHNDCCVLMSVNNNWLVDFAFDY